MNRAEALAILGLTEPELTESALRDAYWAKAKQAHEAGEDLSPINVAKDVLDKEIIQSRLPAIVDANAILTTMLQAQAKRSVTQSASDKLSENVRWAFLKFVRRSRTLRDAVLVCGGIGGGASFLLNSFNLPARANTDAGFRVDATYTVESIVRWLAANEILIQFGLWAIVLYAGVLAFWLNLRIQRVEEMRDDVLKQLSREANRQIILDNVYRGLPTTLMVNEFRERLQSELDAQMKTNRLPFFVRRLRAELAADLEDFLLSSGVLTTELDTNGERCMRRVDGA